MPDEPSMGELLRRVDQVSAQVVEVARDLRDLQEKTAVMYLRQDLYVAHRTADQAVVTDQAGDIKSMHSDRQIDVQWRRQVMLTMAGLCITVLLTVGVAISNFIARLTS